MKRTGFPEGETPVLLRILICVEKQYKDVRIRKEAALTAWARIDGS